MKLPRTVGAQNAANQSVASTTRATSDINIAVGRTEFQMRMYECLYVTMGGEPMTHTLSRTRLKSANEVNS